MKYFNVCYECLDAHDDYSAKCDKEDTEKICYQWASSDTLESLDDAHHRELAENGADFETQDNSINDDEEHSNVLGLKGQRQKDAVVTAKRIMKLSGWLNKCDDGLPNIDSFTPVEPSINQMGKMWRAAVLAKKQEILKERMKHLPTKINAKSATSNPNPNEVKVVDKSYINKMFNLTSPVNNNTINNTVDKFHLNSEQQRAF
jgi:hypothetical protein